MKHTTVATADRRWCPSGPAAVDDGVTGGGARG
jgi:hypothetical protein